MRLVNGRTDAVVAAHVEVAATRRARRQGLLGRASLDSASAMLITPCCAVHTVRMRFPIDVAFVDRHGRAVRLVHALKPWRIAAAFGAHAVVELAAGRLAACSVREGDRLYLSPEGAAC
jgi:uncharacterized membrane protein (UPF0127 family)